GFERITLRPGESRRVDFHIDTDMLRFYNADLEFVAEPGDFEAQIGRNSLDVGTATFTLL
ncbi:MAG: fibronectin type III-like domain-contianing protein, partial [Muribaculaceae bacterium]|nr:fibronectin type III-like domain-contianing protein [Muribaculaceae bacterium]